MVDAFLHDSVELKDNSSELKNNFTFAPQFKKNYRNNF
jgi:hypothetical protein